MEGALQAGIVVNWESRQFLSSASE